MNTKSPATTAWEYGPAGAGPFSAITVFLIDSPFLPDRPPPACIHVQLRRRSRGSRRAPLYNRAFSSLLQRACLYGLRPVDQDVRDPLGEVFGVFVGGRVQDGLGVEHDQVRGVSWCDEPPLAQLEPAGREGGHLPPVLLEEQVHHAILGVYPSCLASFQNVLARQVRIIISAQRGDVHAIPSRGS